MSFQRKINKYGRKLGIGGTGLALVLGGGAVIVGAAMSPSISNQVAKGIWFVQRKLGKAPQVGPPRG